MDVDEFRKRQQADLQRHQTGENVVRRRPFHERYAHLDRSGQENDHYNDDDNDDDDDALATDSDDEADEEIQSPSILNHRSSAEDEEGEEA